MEDGCLIRIYSRMIKDENYLGIGKDIRFYLYL